MRIFKSTLPFFSIAAGAFLLLTAACARQGYPTGGPKDTEPPVALGCRPANESRHFNAKEFYIQFDEYVTLKNAEQNVLVSPPLVHKPQYSTKGKGVLVRIEDTLRPDATYLFQFKEAIADFNEGNLLPSFEYVFSTGSHMDTMMIEGAVHEALTDKPWKETVTVMAYRLSDTLPVTAYDTIATSQQPHYVTRCDKEGHFAFHYIPAGRYRIVALEDKNSNLRIDPAEAAAWDTAVYASYDTSIHTLAPHLRLSAPFTTKQRVLSSEFTAPAHIVIATQLPMTHPTLQGIEAEWRLNIRKDTLTLWCLNPQVDSATLILHDEGIQDTLKLKYKAPRTRRSPAGKSQPKEPLMRSLCSGNDAFYDDLRLAFSTPVVRVADSARAEVMHLKDSSVSHCQIEVDSTGLFAKLQTSLQSGEEYRIRLADSLFTDLYGRVNDSLSFSLTPKDYGTLLLHIQNNTPYPLSIEVLDKRDTVVQRQTLTTHGDLRFKHLSEGEYRLRAVLDADANGMWTTGDYRLQRQPEEVVYFKKTLNLRQKWEMEERWVVERGYRTP